MHFVGRTVAALCLDRKAATAVEYGLILALVVIAVFVGIANLGGAAKGMWRDIMDKVAATTPK